MPVNGLLVENVDIYNKARQNWHVGPSNVNELFSIGNDIIWYDFDWQ